MTMRGKFDISNYPTTFLSLESPRSCRGRSRSGGRKCGECRSDLIDNRLDQFGDARDRQNFIEQRIERRHELIDQPRKHFPLLWLIPRVPDL
jgi:hypothetical protein